MNPYQAHPKPRRAAAIAVLLALFGIVASLTATGAAAQRVDKIPEGLDLPEPAVVLVPRKALSATIDVSCPSAVKAQVATVVTNHSLTSQKATFEWTDPAGQTHDNTTTVDAGTSNTLVRWFADGTTYVFRTRDGNGNVLAQRVHTFDCRPKRAHPEPNAAAEVVCPHPGAAVLVVKLGNTGSAPAAFEVSVVSTGNHAPVPQPGITLIAA
ncbi:MAG: hypothetical protein ACR2OH_04755, partial [Microthrixaceae bacterium]